MRVQHVVPWTQRLKVISTETHFAQGGIRIGEKVNGRLSERVIGQHLFDNLARLLRL